MDKKRILAGLTALFMAASFAGCGNTDSGTAAKSGADGKAETETQEVKAALTVDEAAKTIEEKLEKVQNAVNGELEQGSSGTITYTAPSSGEIAEYGLKPMSVSAEAKQKDKISGADYTFGYDGTNLLTVNVVYDNEKETAYLKIPELSDGVLTGTVDEIENWLNSSFTAPVDEMMTVSGDETQTDDTQAAEMVDVDALKDVDFSALSDDLASYVDTVKENAPEAADGEDYTVTSSNVSITLSHKIYTITPEDQQKINNAVKEKGLADETLKNLFSGLGMTDSEYEELWSDDEEGSADQTITVDVYYGEGDKVMGLNVDEGDGKSDKYIIASDESNIIVDVDINEDDHTTANGLVTLKDDILDGTITFEYQFDPTSEGEPETYTLEYKALKVTDDELTGGIDFTASDDSVVSLLFNCVGDKNDVTISGSTMGEDFGTLNVVSQLTDASDVAVPTGDMYDLTNDEEMQKYLETCDIEGLQESVKNAMGDAYTKIFEGEAYTDDYDYEDFDFSDEDFDFSDEDLDLSDLELDLTEENA